MAPPKAPDNVREWFTCDNVALPNGPVVCACQGCNPSCNGYAEEPDVIGVNHGAGGLGDQLLGLCAVKGLQASTRRPIAYAVSPLGRPFVELFDGWDYLRCHTHDECKETPPPGPLLQINAGYLNECRTRAATPRLERYLANIGSSSPLLPVLRDRERLEDLGRAWRGCVIIAPFSSTPTRDWRVESWLTLERDLAAAGWRVVLVHSSADRTAGFKCDKLIAPSAEGLTAAALNAAGVVAGDSGIAHLAGILGRPTIVVCGQTTGSQIYGFYPHVVAMQGKLFCDGCWWQAPFAGLTCDTTCASMQSITPGDVVKALEVAIFSSIDQGRSCLGAEKLSILCAEFRRSIILTGDVAELGVWKGGTAKALRSLMTHGTLHLFDTFEGLPFDDVEAGGLHRRGDFADTSADSVRQLIPDAELHVGLFPSTAVDGLRFRFVHVDLDLYESTLAAIDYLAPRMVDGGVIVFDDYAWPHTPGVQRAIHERFGFHVPLGRPSLHQAVLRFPIGHT